MTEIPSVSTPEPQREPAWWIAVKVAAFVAVPVALIYAVKLLLG